jgi:hypothetical protein
MLKAAAAPAPIACRVPVIEAIVQYGKAIPVFPCRRSAEIINGRLYKPKSPYTLHGFKEASRDEDQIRAWWREHPDALVGMPTGSATRLLCIDYDPDKATAETNDWISEHTDALMSGFSYQTARGGRHYLFNVPENSRYPSGTDVVLDGKRRPGIDIRGEGGYIIYWPLHGFQKTGELTWLPAGLVDDRRVEKREMMPLPTRTPEQWAADKALLMQALRYLDPSVYKEEWINPGLAIHLASGGSEDGFALWDAYSAGEFSTEIPHNYAGTEECRHKWATFLHDKDRAETVTLGSVFALAKLRGWSPVPTGFSAESITAADAPTEERGDDGFEWPTPADFLKKISPPQFDDDDVPKCLSMYAREWSNATGFDVNGVLACSVAASSAALSDGLRLLVNPASSYYESARLWMTLIGPPGVAKTPSMGAATAPIKTMHRELFQEWRTEAMRVRKLAEARDETPEIPPRPALYTSDATVEALAELLVGNERGMFFLSEEFESWLGSHDAYRSGGSKDRGEWLRAYDGGPHQVDRIKRGSFFVPNWGIGILSATTPGALQKLSHKLPVDGLMQRFIPIVVSPGGDPKPDADVSLAEREYHNTLVRLYQYGPAKGVRVVSLSHEAATVLRAEMARLRTLALDVEIYGEAFSGHVAKHSGMLARLTLAFHALTLTEQRHPADVPVAASTVAMAGRFMRKVFRHALAVYSDLLGNDSAVTLARAVARFLLAGEYRQIVRRDLMQLCKAWRKADNDRLRDEAMQFLCDMGWVRELDGQYTKGHVTHWAVNPLAQSRYRAYGEEHKERRLRVLEAIKEGE